MKKKIILCFTASLILSLSLIYAINLEVSSKPVSNSFVTDFNEPAVFELTIKNLGETEDFQIYSLVGMDMSPKEHITIQSGDIKEIRIELTPQESVKSKKGFFTFEYSIKNSKNEIQKEQLTINIIGLEDAISITPSNINPKSEEITLTIKNQVVRSFNDLKIKIDSVFFDYQADLPLGPSEIKEIKIPTDNKKIKSLNAGKYLANARIETSGKTVNKEFSISFLEQEGIETTEEKQGIIKVRQEIIKKNIGNVKKTVEVEVERSLISYLFTIVSPAATETGIKGFQQHYIWKKELIPDEELKITVTTNWFFPLIIVILIALIIYFIKKSVEVDLMLRKKVSFVRAKGGQFALKVSVHLRAKKFIERISVIDKLPPLVNLYEKYGAIAPDKIDLHNKRLEWNIESMNNNEERIFTYIIYSKVEVVGRFELPSARAVYEKDGKVKETTSNRSFFINEPQM